MTTDLKEKLARGGPSIGTWISFGTPDVPEMLADAGFDWLVFDMEHAPLTIALLHTMLQAMAGGRAAALVRVARNDDLMIAQALDAGAAGVIVPMVKTRADAERAVASALYPPQGKRGMGPRRAARYGLDFASYIADANRKVFIALMIETPDGVANAEEIISVPGVDACIIGTGDLASSMGCMNDRTRPDFVAALTKIRDACVKHRVIPGIGYVGSAAKAKAHLDLGFRMIGLGEDTDHLRNGAAMVLDQLKIEMSKG